MDRGSRQDDDTRHISSPISGRSADGSAPALGAGSREFESPHPDQIDLTWRFMGGIIYESVIQRNTQKEISKLEVNSLQVV